MNDLLFYTLLIVLIYYFFVYLPNQKKLNQQTKKTFTTSQSTQTDDEWQTLIDKNQQLSSQIEAYRNLTNNENSELIPALTSLLNNLKTLNRQI